MARFLISTSPFPAHLDWGGLLATARRLARLGHAVLWASGPPVERLVRAAGLEFRALPQAGPDPDATDLAALRGRAEDAPVARQVWPLLLRGSAEGLAPEQRRAMVDYYAPIVAGLVEMWARPAALLRACEAHAALIAEWRPDVVVAEPTVPAAALAAEARGVRLAGCGYPGPYAVVIPFPEVRPAAAAWCHARDDARRRLGLPPAPPRPDPELFFSARDLHLVFFPEWWFEGANPRPSPGAAFVGGAIQEPWTPPPAWLDELPRERPLVVLARASSYASPAGALRHVFDAVGRLGAFGVIGGAERLRAACEPLPAHIRWEPWLPYEHVLPRAAVAAHHGGLGTTHAAILHGVPQLVIAEAADQVVHARGVRASGAGIALDAGCGAEAVRLALRALLTQARFRGAADELRARFAGLGGVARAAELLVDLAGRRAAG